MTTIETIACLAGVSSATVSKVLNNRPYVSAEKRARIEQVIAATGYVPSQRARGLSISRSSILGLLIPYTSDQLFADPHLLECMRGIEDVANTHTYNVLLSTAHAPAEAVSAGVRLLQSAVIDGTIVVETSDVQPFTLALGHSASPLVVIGYARDGTTPSVHADDYGGAVVAMQHLLTLGHQRIGIIGSTLRPFAVDERLRGIHATLADHGLASDSHLFAEGDFSVESGEQAGHFLLDQPLPPTAIFALNDRMALGVARAAAARRLRIPADLSLVGFDDIALATWMTPRLTTVRQSGFALGGAAARAFFAKLAGEQPSTTTVIPTELVLRESTAAPFGKEG